MGSNWQVIVCSEAIGLRFNCSSLLLWALNTQYMTNSTLVCPVKIEYVTNNNIFGLKMMMKSGLEKNIWNSSMLKPFSIKWIYLIEKRSFYQKYKFSNKNDMVCTWRNFKNIFSRPLFTIIFRPKIFFFVTYSILTGQTKVEFVIYWVLIESRKVNRDLLYRSVFTSRFPKIVCTLFKYVFNC